MGSSKMQGRSHLLEGVTLRDIKRVYSAFAPHVRKYRKRFALEYLALFAATAMNLLKPWPLKIVFDYILLNKPMPHWIKLASSAAGDDKLILLAVLCAGIVVIVCLEDLFTFTRKYFMASGGEKAIKDIRQRVFGHRFPETYADPAHSDLCELFFHFCRHRCHHVFDGLAAYAVGTRS
jgi:ABC-type bacteriocin/lantibiotic exporter with double-glycine peptidase domain